MERSDATSKMNRIDHKISVKSEW